MKSETQPKDVAYGAHLIITYAHCIKATPGELDRSPHYQYELRDASVTIKATLQDGEDWTVEHQGQVIADADTRDVALCLSLL